MSKDRALFLIDGSNFYHTLQGAGLSKGDLSYRKLAEQLSKGRKIVAVRFFICSVHPSNGLKKAQAQQRFFSFLKNDGVTIKLGTLAKRKRKCPQCEAVENFRIEKGVDILLAMDAVLGAIEDKYDVLYLFTCDSDFAPVVEFVRSIGKKVFLAPPKGAKYHALGKKCNAAIPINQETIDLCQPDPTLPL